MAKVGVEKWCVVPVMNLGEQATKAERLRAETYFIHTFEARLNMRDVRAKGHKKKRRSTRNKIWNRAEKGRKIADVSARRPTTYMCKNVQGGRTFCAFDILLDNAAGNDGWIDVERKGGDYDLTDWRRVRRNWGLSSVRRDDVESDRPEKLRERDIEGWLGGMANRKMRIVVRVCEYEQVAEKVVKHIAEKPRIEQRFLRKCTNEQLLDLYWRVNRTLQGQ
jgi:hypothetical protein